MKNHKIFYLFIALIIFAFSSKAQQQVPNIGDPRLDFTVVTLKGDSVKLSSMKGKVFLLDFWASWCGPCRASNKQMVKFYNRYKDKGFEIFGVSLDDETGDWKKAITKDKINWFQGIDKGGWDAMSAAKWNINAIPASFLINKNGDVVAVDPERGELEKMLKELLEL